MAVAFFVILSIIRYDFCIFSTPYLWSYVWKGSPVSWESNTLDSSISSGLTIPRTSYGDLAMLPRFSLLHLISTQNNRSVCICLYLAWDITCPSPGIVQGQVVWDLEQLGVVEGVPFLTGGGTGWLLKSILTQTILWFYGDAQPTFAKSWTWLSLWICNKSSNRATFTLPQFFCFVFGFFGLFFFKETLSLF